MPKTPGHPPLKFAELEITAVGKIAEKHDISVMGFEIPTADAVLASISQGDEGEGEEDVRPVEYVHFTRPKYLGHLPFGLHRRLSRKSFPTDIEKNGTMRYRPKTL